MGGKKWTRLLPSKITSYNHLITNIYTSLTSITILTDYLTVLGLHPHVGLVHATRAVPTTRLSIESCDGAYPSTCSLPSLQASAPFFCAVVNAGLMRCHRPDKVAGVPRSRLSNGDSLCFVLSLTRSYSLGPCCQLQRPISRLGCPRNLACKNGKSGAASTVCVSFLPSSIGENAVKWKRRPEKRASRISWRTSASGVPLQSGKRPCASNRRLIVSSPSSFPISPLAFAYGLRKCIWALWLLCHRQQWTS